ncbi:hypothetical protein SDC9_146341 [bioreactor metagenome]|uniref:Uncharacterized protein n=1 Tax=bioreactor metagenome TaxID=1076179 RepID=A0A645EBD2_9ZZZZ
MGSIGRRIGSGTKEINFYLYRRVAEQAQELRFRDYFGRHEVEQQNF